MSVLPFLTSWDPTDLPGQSVDPLGFDRTYTWLADLLVPGLTNVARQPRYFSLLCAGASLGTGDNPSPTPTRAEVAGRQEVMLRLERLWALGHALVERKKPGFSVGVRGITFADDQANELERRSATSTSTKFTLLGSQSRYGMLGIYANVANTLNLVDRDSLLASPDAGELLGVEFLEGTSAPESVLRAAREETSRAEVPCTELEAWVRKAGVSVRPGAAEAKLLAAAFNADERRARLGNALAKLTWKSSKSELEFLGRLETKLSKRDDDLRETAQAIRSFEVAYQWAVLVFERLLWRSQQEASVPVSKLLGDDVLRRASVEWPRAVDAFFAELDGARSGTFQLGEGRAADLRLFLSEVRQERKDLQRLIEVVLKRHADVQRGKFERDRPKSPWLEVVKATLQPTMARASQLSGEPIDPAEIPPHEYRLRSARALLLSRETSS